VCVRAHRIPTGEPVARCTYVVLLNVPQSLDFLISCSWLQVRGECINVCSGEVGLCAPHGEN